MFARISRIVNKMQSFFFQNLTRKRRYVSAASVANKLYVVGGYDGQSRLSLVEKLDFTQEKLQWEPVTSMHQRRGLAGICVYKGMVINCLCQGINVKLLLSCRQFSLTQS